MATKQIIVVREDLNMSRGKIGSQIAHASMKVMADAMTKSYDEDGNFIGMILTFGDNANDEELKDWLTNSFTKIVVYVNSEEKLMNLYHKVQEAGLRTALIIDNGTTEFNGERTKTCIAIGPHTAERLDPITKRYPLLK